MFLHSMALPHILQRRVRARKAEEEFEDVERSESELESEQGGSEAKSSNDAEDSSGEDGPEQSDLESDDAMVS